MKTPHKIPDPEGWEKLWPFADEVRLWDIPAPEARAALQWEMFREKNKEPASSIIWAMFNKSIKEPYDVFTDNKPWLLLNRETRKAIEKRLSKNALHITDTGATERAKSKGIIVDIDTGDPECGQMELAIYQDEYGFVTDLGKGMRVTDEGRDLVCLSIDPNAGLEEIENAFKAALKEIGITGKSGTTKTKDAQRSLRALAIYRAKLVSDKDYMRFFFTGTPYWGEKKDQKRRVQGIEKKLKEQ